jgi:hypothetical protein
MSIMHEASDLQLLPTNTAAEKRLLEQLAQGRQQRGGGSGSQAAEAAAQQQQQEEPSTSGRCFYTSLPRLTKLAGQSAAARTAANLDRSEALQAAAAQAWRGDAWALLGELEFAYIAFVYGQSLDGEALLQGSCSLAARRGPGWAGRLGLALLVAAPAAQSLSCSAGRLPAALLQVIGSGRRCCP